jgi:hypothetical protein
VSNLRAYDESYPPSILGPPATGATAGTPGTWTPPGSKAPASRNALATGVPNAVTANPATPWTTNQRMVCLNGELASWSGTSWVGGPAPLAEFDPKDFTIAEVLDYVDANPDELADVLLLELDGKNRSTLIAQLEERGE